MNIKIRLMRSTSRAPTYATDGSSGMDCYADILDQIVLLPASRCCIGLGFAASIPPGFELQVRPRSGLAKRYGVDVHFGTIDSDYRGEVRAIIFNHDAHYELRINPGYRVCQAVLSPVLRAEFEIVDQLDSTARGDRGFGSSGR